MGGAIPSVPPLRREPRPLIGRAGCPSALGRGGPGVFPAGPGSAAAAGGGGAMGRRGVVPAAVLLVAACLAGEAAGAGRE